MVYYPPPHRGLDTGCAAQARLHTIDLRVVVTRLTLTVCLPRALGVRIYLAGLRYLPRFSFTPTLYEKRCQDSSRPIGLRATLVPPVAGSAKTWRFGHEAQTGHISVATYTYRRVFFIAEHTLISLPQKIHMLAHAHMLGDRSVSRKNNCAHTHDVRARGCLESLDSTAVCSARGQSTISREDPHAVQMYQCTSVTPEQFPRARICAHNSTRPKKNMGMGMPRRYGQREGGGSNE